MKKKFIYIVFLSALLSACGDFSLDDRTPVVPEIYVNHSSSVILVGDKLQLTASPASFTFYWESVDPSVATVSQTGEVTAVKAGSTDIIVTADGQDDIRTQVSVTTKDKIFLDRIKVNATELELTPGNTAQLSATAEPIEITVPYETFRWTSDNPEIATVSESGLVTAVAKGVTKIRVSSGNISTVIDLTVYRTQGADRTQFSIVAVSDQTEWDGGGVTVILEQFNPWEQNRFWHSQWHDGINAPCPHWVVIDMGKERTIAAIEVWRRWENSDTKTVRSYVGSDPEVDASSWITFGESQFPGYWSWDWGNFAGSLRFLITSHSANGLKNMKKGRYLKIVLPDSNRDPFISVSQVRVNELVE